MHRVALPLLCVAAFAAQTVAAPFQFNRAKPAEVGMSAKRLERVEELNRRFVDEGKYAGINTLVLRNGRVAHLDSYGFRDIEKKLPMEADTICRAYSMSKIVTSVAILKLIEDGKLLLDDPLSKFYPETSDPQIFLGGTADAPQLEKAGRSVTIRELLTHTSGYIYDFAGDSPLIQLYRKQDLWNAPSLAEFMKRVSRLPLQHAPGARYTYGINTDILGAVVEKVSGQTFEDYLQGALFKPLKMSDTSFDVATSKMDRLAVVYETPNGKFTPAQPLIETWPQPGRGIQSGGAGLFSTITDYARFAQMLLNGGELDGVRILSPKTVELMTVNQLSRLPQAHNGDAARGFGLGVDVLIDLAHSRSLGSLGQFGWYGAASTYCQIDPKEKVVAIAFAQHFPFNQHNYFSQFANAYYQAIEK